MRSYIIIKRLLGVYRLELWELVRFKFLINIEYIDLLFIVLRNIIVIKREKDFFYI